MAKPQTTGENVFKPTPNNKCKYFVEVLLNDTIDCSATSLNTRNRHGFWVESIDKAKSKLKSLSSKGIKQVLVWNSIIYWGDETRHAVYGLRDLAGVDKIIGNFSYNYDKDMLEPLAIEGFLVSKSVNKTKDMKHLFSFLKELSKNGR